MTYMMRGFGLIISSDFPLAQMRKAPDTGEPDVKIISAPAPSELVREPIRTWPDCILGRKEMWTEIENVVRLYAANGNEIRVERLFTDPDREGEMQAYVTGLALGAILHQRGAVPMHGSCVARDGKGILITGVSGAGKSSLSAEALRRGYRLVTDDVTPIRLENGKVMAEPSFPQQKLWEDAIDRGGSWDMKDHPVFKEESRTKFAMDVGDSFLDETVELVGVLQLIPKEGEQGDRPLLKEVTGLEKAVLLQIHTYRTYLLVTAEDRQAHFQKCASCASHLSEAHLFRYEGTTEAELWDKTEEFIYE